MGDRYSDEDLTDWADVFNNVSDFLVTRGDSRLLLDADLNVRDSDDPVLEQELNRELGARESRFPAGSLADHVWRVQVAAHAVGAESSFDDTPWGLAGAYLADAMEFVIEEASLEAEAILKRAEADKVEDGGSAAPVLKWLFAEEKRRRSATSALAAMFSAQEAAFFEAAEWFQLPIAEADKLSRAGFPAKWTKLFYRAETERPEEPALAVVQECFECRHQLVHIPPRIRRTCTPDDVFLKLLPTNEKLAEWVAALERLLTTYLEALDFPVELPTWDDYPEQQEFSRRLREELPIDDLFGGDE